MTAPHLITRVLPPVTPDGLFYIVVLFLTEGGVEVVTSEEKAAKRMLDHPGTYTHFEYVLVT